ncbi:MAG: hypothetical protein SV062_06205 [Thermodesulfobacteriota bacterium]|nr:hypothetical protein [Thermodesulfobacteriota bacterium]
MVACEKGIKTSINKGVIIMADYAKIMIDRNALSSLQESIDIGKQVLQRKLTAYLNKIERFEEAKGMDTATFNRLFGKGELGDNKEWIEWDHVASVVSLLKKKLYDLEKLKYES